MFYSGDTQWSLESATRIQAPSLRSNRGLENNKRKQFSYPREETASAVLSPDLLHWCMVSSGQPWTHLSLHEGLVNLSERGPERKLPRRQGKHGSGTHVCPDPFPATGTQHIQPGLMQVQSTPSEQLPVPRAPLFLTLTLPTPLFLPQVTGIPLMFRRLCSKLYTSSLLPTRCSSCSCSFSDPYIRSRLRSTAPCQWCAKCPIFWDTVLTQPSLAQIPPPLGLP